MQLNRKQNNFEPLFKNSRFINKFEKGEPKINLSSEDLNKIDQEVASNVDQVLGIKSKGRKMVQQLGSKFLQNENKSQPNQNKTPSRVPRIVPPDGVPFEQVENHQSIQAMKNVRGILGGYQDVFDTKNPADRAEKYLKELIKQSKSKAGKQKLQNFLSGLENLITDATSRLQESRPTRDTRVNFSKRLKALVDRYQSANPGETSEGKKPTKKTPETNPSQPTGDGLLASVGEGGWRSFQGETIDAPSPKLLRKKVKEMPIAISQQAEKLKTQLNQKLSDYVGVLINRDQFIQITHAVQLVEEAILAKENDPQRFNQYLKLYKNLNQTVNNLINSSESISNEDFTYIAIEAANSNKVPNISTVQQLAKNFGKKLKLKQALQSTSLDLNWKLSKLAKEGQYLDQAMALKLKKLIENQFKKMGNQKKQLEYYQGILDTIDYLSERKVGKQEYLKVLTANIEGRNIFPTFAFKKPSK